MTVSAKSRSKPVTALEWLSHNQSAVRKSRGSWIVVTKSGIIARGNLMADVMGTAKNMRSSGAIVFKVPQERKISRIVSVRAK